MLSRTTRYAFRILSFLVQRQGSRTRSAEIARATGIPLNYLSKILNQLRKQGVVDSEKGWGGGFELRSDARNRSICEILRIFDGVETARGHRECVFGLTRCDAQNPCPLHPQWDRIQGALEEMLTSTSVEDLGGP